MAAQSANDLFNQAVAAGTAYRIAHPAYIQAKNQHQQYGTGATRLAALTGLGGGNSFAQVNASALVGRTRKSYN